MEKALIARLWSLGRGWSYSVGGAMVQEHTGRRKNPEERTLEGRGRSVAVAVAIANVASWSLTLSMAAERV